MSGQVCEIHRLCYRTGLKQRSRFQVFIDHIWIKQANGLQTHTNAQQHMLTWIHTTCILKYRKIKSWPKDEGMKEEKQTNGQPASHTGSQVKSDRHTNNDNFKQKRNSSWYYCHANFHCRFNFKATAHRYTLTYTIKLLTIVQQFMLYATSNTIDDKMCISLPP